MQVEDFADKDMYIGTELPRVRQFADTEYTERYRLTTITIINTHSIIYVRKFTAAAYAWRID